VCTAISSFRQLQRHSMPRRRQSPLLTREEIGRKMADKFCLWPDFHVITGFFSTPQICDMGQTALLPFLRKAGWGFFLPEKIWRLRPGLNPGTRGHRSCLVQGKNIVWGFLQWKHYYSVNNKLHTVGSLTCFTYHGYPCGHLTAMFLKVKNIKKKP
jgi:hypothetical protein